MELMWDTESIARELVRSFSAGFSLNKKALIKSLRCSYIIGSDGKPHPFTSERLKEINATVISQMANNGLRTICVAYKNLIRKDVRETEKNEACISVTI